MSHLMLLEEVVGFGARNSIRKTRVGSLRDQFTGNSRGQRQSSAHRAGSDTDAPHAKAFQHGNWRHAWHRKNVHRSIDSISEPANGFRITDARHKKAVRTG